MRLKIGMKANGRITAVDAEVVQRGGAYAGYGLVTILYAGALLHALYKLGASRYRGYRVYTNLPPCGAMRGHGAVQSALRVRGAARRDGRASSGSIRSRCGAPTCSPRSPYRTLNDLQVNSYGLPRVHRRGREGVGLARAARQAAATPGFKRGLGMACSHYVAGSAKPVHWSGEPHAVINLKLDFDGGDHRR